MSRYHQVSCEWNVKSVAAERKKTKVKKSLDEDLLSMLSKKNKRKKKNSLVPNEDKTSKLDFKHTVTT
jgi:hypothetical protein